MKNNKSLVEQIDFTIGALQSCKKSNNEEWCEKHLESIKQIEKRLPSGGGIDAGCKINIDESGPNKIVIDTSFRFTDDNGYYTNWRDYKIVVTPSFHGININVKGVNQRDIKDYLEFVFFYCLLET
jgi:hypothetical protein